MMECDIILENGVIACAEKGNKIIADIIKCVKGKGCTLDEARFLMNEAKKELSSNTIV